MKARTEEAKSVFDFVTERSADNRKKLQEEADSSVTAKIFGKKFARWIDGVEDVPEKNKEAQRKEKEKVKEQGKKDAAKAQEPSKKDTSEKNKAEEKKPEKSTSTSAKINKTLKAEPAPAATIVVDTEEKPQPPGTLKKWFAPKTYKKELELYRRNRKDHRQEVTDGIKAKYELKKAQARGFKM